MHGFINVNKPQGITSFDVIRKLRQHSPGTKMGHLGTLDPMVRGVLPLALGYGTRLIEYITDNTKAYTATMTLGGISDTQDAWGEITYTHQTTFKVEELHDILPSFTGVIEQIPPMYSAVHHQGQRLYELARQGLTVDRQPRQVEIKSLQLLDININDKGLPLIKLQVECSPGTYIRTLCHDIGNLLGTGAYLSELIRTRTGVFTIENSWELDYILDNDLESCLLPLDYPLSMLPRIVVTSEEDYFRIMNGNFIPGEDHYSLGITRIYSADQRLIAMARCVKTDNTLLVKPLKVFK